MQVTTDRLLLIRVAAEQAADLAILHDRRDVARWYAGRWTAEEAHGWAEQTTAMAETTEWTSGWRNP